MRHSSKCYVQRIPNDDGAKKKIEPTHILRFEDDNYELYYLLL